MEIYLITAPEIDWRELQRFGENELGVNNVGDMLAMSESMGENIVEAAGRMCYMSYGKGRNSSADYLRNLIDSGHTSVLEHANYGFIFTGVSRSLLAEFTRHRVGVSYSVLSQRYVDESNTEFVCPPFIEKNKELKYQWETYVEQAKTNYIELQSLLKDKICISDKTAKRKALRGTARCVLPNATETKMFVTMNLRSIRHFFDLRGNLHADIEIRQLAIKLYEIMRKETPVLFEDYTIDISDDGEEYLRGNNGSL